MSRKIIRADSELALEQAHSVLAGGGLLIYPTETFYALGADGANEKALARIYRIKKRDRSKPLPLIVGFQFFKKSALDPGKTALEIAERYWPGPLTIVTKIRNEAALAAVDENSKAALRVSSHRFAGELADRFGGAIISTSANISQNRPATEVKMIDREIAAGVDLIVDGGPTPGGEPSTVIEIENDQIRIIRSGAIDLKWLQSSLPKSEN